MQADDVKGGAKESVGLLKQTFRDFSDDDVPQMAAALSYYTVFALPSLLVLILLIVSVFMDPADVREALAGQIGGVMGSDGAQQITDIMRNAEEPGAKRGFGWVASIAGLVLGATGAFGQLQKALNKAWEVEPDPEQGGIKNMLLKRVFSFGMILGVAFLLLVSLALSAALSAFGDMLGGMGGLSGPLLMALNFAVSFAVITLLFAAMFKILPDAEIRWKDVWVGAAVTTLLFVIGKFGLGLYLGRSNPGEAFGAAASLALLLVWIYYASMILLFGAEFTQTWAERKGAGIQPEEGAVKVVQEKKHVRDGREVPAGKDAKHAKDAAQAKDPAAPRSGATHGKRAAAAQPQAKRGPATAARPTPATRTAAARAGAAGGKGGGGAKNVLLNLAALVMAWRKKPAGK